MGMSWGEMMRSFLLEILMVSQFYRPILGYRGSNNEVLRGGQLLLIDERS